MGQTYRERVLATLRGERSDRVTRGEFFISDEFTRAFLQLPDPGEIEFRHRRAVVQELDLDIASVPFSSGWGALEQPDQDRALATLMEWRAAGDRFLFALIDGPFSAAARARGFNMLMHYAQGAPHAARDLFRLGAEEARVVAQAVRDAGADGVILGEDIAYGRSTYVSPGVLRDLYFPELTAVAREIRALGLIVFFHSDGNLNTILPDLAACGLDGLQGMEPEAGMQLDTTRAQIGAGPTLWGNLGFDWMSVLQSDAQAETAVRALLHSAMSPETGAAREPAKFILGSCAGLVQGLAVETVRRFHRVAARF